MITIESLNSVTIDGALIGADLVTAAQWAFDNARASELLTALTAYEQQLSASTIVPEVEAIDPAQIAELQQLSAAQQTIAAQQAQLSQLIITDWPGLIGDLKNAGFYAWLTAAAAANEDLLDEVALLSAAANAGDRAGVIHEYVAIYQKYPPTTEQLAAWQAVLDDRGIPSNLLAFVPLG